MKKYNYSFLLLLAALLVGTSCNQDEGLGGSSSLEGYVYNVVHQDDNFAFTTDTFPALGKKVYLTFGEELNVGDDVDAGLEGYYRFNYLREGYYTVYALSEEVSGQKTAEIQKVKIGGGRNQSPAIYIHSGKAYGTAMIRGKIHATYYNSSGFERDEGPGIDIRVYICRAGEDPLIASFDDVKSGPNGIFAFQKLLPGDYIVSVVTEATSEKVTLLPSDVIHITKEDIAEKGYYIYDIPTTFEVYIKV